MDFQNPITISLPKSAFKEKEGLVLVPLKKWMKIEEDLEDLEMYRSETLVQEISKRRTDEKTVFLDTLLKKYRI